jgi:hypothetical protein
MANRLKLFNIPYVMLSFPKKITKGYESLKRGAKRQKPGVGYGCQIKKPNIGIGRISM